MTSNNPAAVESAAARPPAATRAITQSGKFAISGFASNYMDYINFYDYFHRVFQLYKNYLSSKTFTYKNNLSYDNSIFNGFINSIIFNEFYWL